MDEVNINKYLGQFNPILIIPVLSAIVGAILFVFGFKRPNEPRFQSNSSSDSLKKSKRKANAVKTTENAVQSSKQQNASSAKLNGGKRANDASAAVAGKKGATNDKSSGTTNTTNNNNTSSTNNNINKKKTDEKKADNGSPAKKIASKKVGKETTTSTNKKQSKGNKNNTIDGKDIGEKPVDFDDGGWFTVQSKSTKQKNKVDEITGNQADGASLKPQPTKNNKTGKVAKVETKPLTAQPVAESTNAADNLVNEQPAIEPKNNDVTVEVTVPEIVAQPEPAPAVVEVIAPTVEKNATTIAPATEVNVVVDNSIAFDELGEWTDIKPDRKRGNKKKSRKD